MKTSELEGKALDYAVALAIYGEPKESDRAYRFYSEWLDKKWPAGSVWKEDSGYTTTLSHSTNWQQGGPLIEEYKIGVDYDDNDRCWCAELLEGHTIEDGPTPLIATMRALVAYKLGDEVDIPEEINYKNSRG